MKHGKKYTEAAKLIDRAKTYEIEEAAPIIKQTATAKFDETIEVNIRTSCDGRHADQAIRGAVVLPHGTGKTVRVLVFAKDAKADEATAAGADYVGGMELVPKIQNEGWLDFDVVGTVTMDVTKAIKDIKAGKIEYRLDKANIVHVPIGKASFSAEQIVENYNALMAAIEKAKPSTVKGQYLKSISIATTMGPGVKLVANKY